jgi:outer membrane autotransporter protein
LGVTGTTGTTGAGTSITSQGSTGFANVVAALNNTSTNTMALSGALDQLSPLGVASFGQNTIVNNADFVAEQFDNTMASLRREDGTFIEGNGQVDTSGLTVLNSDPGIAPIASRLLAWTPSAPVRNSNDQTTYAGFDEKALVPVSPDNVQPRLPWDVFVQGTVVMAQDFSQQGLAHADVNTGGFLASADYHLTPHFLVGAGFAFNHTDGTLDTLGSKATLDSYVPSIYASYVNGGWYANGMANYGFNSLTEDRHLNFGGYSGVAHGASNGDQQMADLDGGYDFHMKRFTFGPTLGTQYSHFNIDPYTEQGSPGANLAVDNQFGDSFRSRLGGHVRYLFSGAGLTIAPHLDASWVHEYLNQSKRVSASFADIGSGTFQTTLPGGQRDAALLNTGIDLQINNNLMSFANYSAQVGQSHFFAQSVQAGFRIDF